MNQPVAKFIHICDRDIFEDGGNLVNITSRDVYLNQALARFYSINGASVLVEI